MNNQRNKDGRRVVERLPCSIPYGGQQLQPDSEGTEEPLLRAQNRCIGVQVREGYDAVGTDNHQGDRVDDRISGKICVKVKKMETK